MQRAELMREQSEKYLWNPRMHQDTPHGPSEYLIKIIWIAKTRTLCKFVCTNCFKKFPCCWCFHTIWIKQYISPVAPVLWHWASNYHTVISLMSGFEDRDEFNLQKPTFLVGPVIGWGLLCKLRHFQRGWLLANWTYLASKDLFCSGRSESFGLFEQI